MTLPETEIEANPFDAFDSIAEICGFVWKKGGEDDLRKLLTMQVGSCREPFEDAADDLRVVGLTKAAAIVAEFAEKLSPKVEVCPHDPNTPNGRQWLQFQKNRERQRQWERQRKRERLGLTPNRPS